MIHSKAYDVEILPNFFSVTIVDLNDYLNTFKDIVNEKGKPIPLIQILTVKEIKNKLQKVKKQQFYITDTDDSQLLPMLGYFNNCRSYKDEHGINHRTDIFGYNSMNYDKLIIAAFLMYATNLPVKQLITKLYETSKQIIELQSDIHLFYNNVYIKTLSSFQLPYIDIDVFKVLRLDKAGGKGVDDKGNTVYFGKSLKQTSINLQWYELLEYELPPISDKDNHFYLDKKQYRGFTNQELNKLIDKWDRYIIPEWIEPTIYYNTNDVFIVCEIIRIKIEEIRMRYIISHNYNVNVLNASRSKISDMLFEKFYSEFSGLAPQQWKGKITERTKLSFKRVIFPFITFKTPELQDFLFEFKQVVINSLGKKGIKEVAYKYPNFKYLKTNTESGWFEVKIHNLIYTIATGGLHSQDIPRELKSKIIYRDGVEPSSTGQQIWSNITDDSYIYIHWDISSFYPSLMVQYEIAPDHLVKSVFVKLIKWLRDTRVKAKHSVEPLVDGIPKVVVAEVLKIVINAIYGKLGDINSQICDRLAALTVTLNGQLLILMLCEELELNGIEVISANTDGIVVKIYKKDKTKFDEIADNWKQLTGLEADSEEYIRYINRDINNYFTQQVNGKEDKKGALNPDACIESIDKGYDMPVVAKAIINFFLFNIPILDSLYNEKNILNFCKTQNVGKQFHVESIDNLGNTKILQRNVRYYVSNVGVKLFKVHNLTTAKTGLVANDTVTILNSLDDDNINNRNINYVYYYNECIKIIEPIKLGISPSQKGNSINKTKSGKALLKDYAGQWNTLFDDNE